MTWRRVSVTVPYGRLYNSILTDVSGYVEPRHLVALMGPSGCGKTTLLDCLAGRSPKRLGVSGEVRVNGHVTQMSYGTVAYVQQDDLLTGTLTVRETLLFTARLRLTGSEAAHVRRVEETMHELGLTSAAHALVGTAFVKGLSAGRKRRLSIAVEVLVEPAIICLDEPTSGLDSASAYFCVRALRRLADDGRAVLLAVHQPSPEAFDMLDELLLLSRGCMVYFGPALEAAQFYAAAGHPCPLVRSLPDHLVFTINTDFKEVAQDFHNPAFWEMRSGGASSRRSAHPERSGAGSSSEGSPSGVARGGAGPHARSTAARAGNWVKVNDADVGIADLTNRFEFFLRGNIEAAVAQIAAVRHLPYGGITNTVLPMSQLATLTWRNLLNTWRDIGVFWLRLAIYVVLSAALGTIYYQLGQSWADTTSRGGLIFFSVSFLTFMSISGFPGFVDAMHVYGRERRNGYYGALPFTVAGTLAVAPFLAVISAVCCPVVYLLAGLNPSLDRIAYFILNVFSALMVVEALMMNIAALVQHYLLGIAIGAGILGIFMPIAGFIIPVNDIPKPIWRYPMHYISFHTYSLSGLMTNEFSGTSGWACPCSLQMGGCAESGCTLTGDEVLVILSLKSTPGKFWDIAILWVMVFGLRLAFFAMLKARELMAR